MSTLYEDLSKAVTDFIRSNRNGMSKVRIYMNPDLLKHKSKPSWYGLLPRFLKLRWIKCRNEVYELAFKNTSLYSLWWKVWISLDKGHE